MEIHSRWLDCQIKNRKRSVVCCNCGHIGRDRKQYLQYRFCPMCGAVMDMPNITDAAMDALTKLGSNSHDD